MRRRGRMDKEYEALRQEILQWQSRRFTIVGGSIIIVTTILGWIITTPAKWSWEIASILPLAFLISACYLTWLFSRFNVMIGAYLEVFHESDWDRRVRVFKSGIKAIRLNSALALLYSGLGVISVVISYTVCSKPSTKFGIGLFVAVFLLFVFMLTNLTFLSYPRKRYVSRWQKIKTQEQGEKND